MKTNTSKGEDVTYRSLRSFVRAFFPSELLREDTNPRMMRRFETAELARSHISHIRGKKPQVGRKIQKAR